MKQYYLEVLEPFGWKRVSDKSQWFTEYNKRAFRNMINDSLLPQGQPLHGMYRIVDNEGAVCWVYNRKARDGRYLWKRTPIKHQSR